MKNNLHYLFSFIVLLFISCSSENQDIIIEDANIQIQGPKPADHQKNIKEQTTSEQEVSIANRSKWRLPAGQSKRGTQIVGHHLQQIQLRSKTMKQ